MKSLFTRISQKHDVEANWRNYLSFIPLKGEVIVYDPDDNYSYPRIKIGNGISYINDLPFIYEDRILNNTNKNNLLAYYNPDLINIEYTNNNGGWKIDMVDCTNPSSPQNMPVIGNAIFSQAHEDWVEQKFEFDANGVTNAKMSIYSITPSPGEFMLDDVQLVLDEISAPPVNHINTIYNSDRDSWNDWQKHQQTFADEDVMILKGPGSWDGLANTSFSVEPNSRCFVTITVQNIIGGANFKVTDNNGNKLASKYLSSAHANQTFSYSFIPTTSLITVNFSGDGTEVPAQIELQRFGLKYQDSFYEDAETGSKLDGDWIVSDSDWYSLPFKDTEKHSGTKSIRFKGSQKYWGSATRPVSIAPNVPYHLCFWAKGESGAFNVKIKQDSTTIAMTTVRAEEATDWTFYDLHFVSPVRNVIVELQLNGDYTNLFFIDELKLEAVEGGTSPLLNGDFSELRYNDNTKARHWDFTYGQSYVEDHMIHLVSANDKQYSSGLSQAIVLHPQGHYIVTFRSKRVTRSYIWKPYMTMMPEDKIAFVTGQKGYVPARIQSPWGNSFSPAHQLRVTIDSPYDYGIRSRAIGITAQIGSTNKFYVQVECSKNKQDYEVYDIYEFDSFGLQTIQEYLISFNELLIGNNDFSYITNIRLTFYTLDTAFGSAYEDIIYHVFVYGDYITPEGFIEHKEFVNDANGNVKFVNKIIAPQLIATIDDGNLDF